MKTALVLLLLSGCTASQAFIVTGESLDSVGQQFIAVSNAMQAGQKSGAVSREQFLAWAEFSKRFDASYWKAVDSWKTARLAKDDAEAGRLEALFGRVGGELAGFYALVQRLGLVTP